MPRVFSHSRSKAGFTLIELAIVLIVIGVVSAGMLAMVNPGIESARRVNTNNKLNAIETALSAFRMTNNRLPCPGDAQLTDIPANAATYGYEANNASGACAGGAPAANYFYTVNTGASSAFPGSVVAEGAVPVRTLNLPDEFQFDGWGRKFVYAAWTPLTTPNAFLTYGVNPSCGGITIENAGHGNRTTAAAYVLLSLGPDGHGGYLKGGGTTRLNAGVTNADELANCHCTGTGADAGYTATYIQKDTSMDAGDAAHPFADIVRFKDRWQMLDAYDTYSPIGSACVLGTRIDGPTANAEIGFRSAGSGYAFMDRTMDVFDVNNDTINDIVLAQGGLISGTSHAYVLFGHTGIWPSVIDLSSYVFTGSNGFTLSFAGTGYNGNSTPGPFVMADIDGDGTKDLIAWCQECYQYAEAIVVFGQSGGGTWKSNYSAGSGGAPGSNIDGTIAGTIYDTFPKCGLYYGFSAAGHFTADAAAGLLFYLGDTPVSHEPCYGYARGQGRPWPSGGLLNTTAMSNFQFANLGQAPYSPLGATLMNVDGGAYDDIVTGPGYASTVGIVYGSSGPTGGWINGNWYDFNNRNTANNPNGVAINLPNGAATFSIYAAGKVNGMTDFILGEDNAFSAPTLVFYGGPGTNSSNYTAGWTASSVLTGANGMSFSGVAHTGNGWLITDLNGDGINDLVQSSYYNYCCAANEIFIVWGGASSPWASGLSSYTLGSDSKSTAIVWNSPYTNAANPGSVLSVDLNADGINDLIIAEPGSNKVYIIWGQKTWPASINLGSLTPGQATVINGTRGGLFGYSIATGDLNGDGLTDLVICAPQQNNNGVANSGSCYILWGHKGFWFSTINDSSIGG